MGQKYSRSDGKQYPLEIEKSMRSDFWNITSDEFEVEALALFAFQAERCEHYRRYLELMEIGPQSITRIEDIPYIPIELFKSCDVYCGEGEPEMVFTSSSTSGGDSSRHMMADLALYEAAFIEGFKRFYGDVEQWSIYALLPSYLEREGSSLIYMADKLISMAGSGGFYLYDHKALLEDMATDPKPKILLGVSYALWDLAEAHPTALHNTIIMETGGMKGKREEMAKSEFHALLCRAFAVDKIHSEYGMAELTSQAYSVGDNIFRAPEWMRISLRDVNNPLHCDKNPERGGINIIDLASRYSCAFIQTQDIGRKYLDGSFSVEGRIEHSDIRGCNLLVQ